ncbi:MAG: asparaginase [Gammaproteobacteria bacterium]
MRPSRIPDHAALAVATRGVAVESIHYGSIAAVDSKGRLIASAGDPRALTFTRSACKPLQVFPLLAEDGVQRFAFTPEEIAIMCASHSGEPKHVKAVLGILSKIGCNRRDLQCGVHVPLLYQAFGRQPKASETFNALHHNCSGKHAGMLALACLIEAPIKDYLSVEDPVQQRILAAIASMADVPLGDIVVGIDGCSAPNAAIPLRALALAYARLAGGEGMYAEVSGSVFSAVSAHPGMVSGTGRFDHALTQSGRGKWVSKGGAEGVEGIGIKGRGWGIAIKIADGAPRALHVVTIEVLHQLGVLKPPLAKALIPYRRASLLNARGVETGEVMPVFKLG